MDDNPYQPPLPPLASRTRNKAIRIVEPDSGRVVIPVAVPRISLRNPHTLPASNGHNVIPATPKITTGPRSNAKNLPPDVPPLQQTTTGKQTQEPLAVKPPKSIQVEVESVAGDFEHAFDVYARPFVPQALSFVNTLQGHVRETPPLNTMHFENYSKAYVGKAFLPQIPEPITSPPSTTVKPIRSRYEEYFRYHLEAEIASQELQKNSYAIYAASPSKIIRGSLVSSQQTQQCFVSFEVPGVRENSPYIEEDDVLDVRQLLHGQRRERGWTGIIHQARVFSVQRKDKEVILAITDLNMSPAHSPIFNIQFPVQVQRYTPMKEVLPIIQQGLVLYDDHLADASPDIPRHWLQSMLFPIEQDGMMQTRLNPASFNRELFDDQLNREQQLAVERISLQNFGTLPYLISGPPGTGKTKTLVEIALQLLFYDNNISHILVCAPSDQAADTIIQRLAKHLKPQEMLRLNRPPRTFTEVPEAVLPYCHITHGPEQKFSLPPFEQLMCFKIVVTTCRDASLLLYSRMTNYDLFAAEYGLRKTIHPSAKLPRVDLHWGALLIDEAAQATEPEALLPLSVVSPPREFVLVPFMPLFVMVGDECQLGPRTSLPSSPLKKSLLGRLFERSVYAQHPLARSETGKAPPPLSKTMLPILRPAFTNLIRNYRSHPAILAVPSSLFYSDTLESEAEDTGRLASWPEWKGRKWPVLFVSNNSPDDLELDGGGWFNRGEAQIAAQYASSLVESGLVEPKEICIMSPFKAQVVRLRQEVRKTDRNWDVNIGPTEAYQGLEKGVVILCTTRSRQRFVQRDQKADWGLIGMPNKMNVALTRAKFGLIVIGKIDVLMEDPNWKAFIHFCERNGLMAGDIAGGARLEDSGVLTRLEKVLLASENTEETQVLGGVNQDDEMWISEQHATLKMSENGNCV
ncbi:P-loop containing nucleoside triphosphate hydrolase [Glarea lozoyensis ATCC 20868]|uniref:p-loop containing nucleoside triphosphate hydrolase n=1 Tax=Glarea lozoyensis (strain ATCC 20868 / MF5171) TaxID=1116229 RepID=S3D2S3_GLAL2|nr:P-loop containing nucleoside triphosphate hydrolase [Glarea lozoyensis ATCC 20868]EPE32782.1 P-loop containing nucleoside triphosphate hydrolase [Glarea lozoyensis ATCC 20868]